MDLQEPNQLGSEWVKSFQEMQSSRQLDSLLQGFSALTGTVFILPRIGSMDITASFFLPQTHLTTDLVLLCITLNDTMENALENEQPQADRTHTACQHLCTEFEYVQR